MRREPVRLAWVVKVAATLLAWLGLDLPPEAVLGAVVVADALISEAVRRIVTPEDKAKQREVMAAHRAQTAAKGK